MSMICVCVFLQPCLSLTENFIFYSAYCHDLGICLPYPSFWGYRHRTICAQIFVGNGNLNSDPHAHKSSTLIYLTTSLSSLILFFLWSSSSQIVKIFSFFYLGTPLCHLHHPSPTITTKCSSVPGGFSSDIPFSPIMCGLGNLMH